VFLIGVDHAAGRSGRTHVAAATIVAEGMLQCKASKAGSFGIGFRLLKKNPLSVAAVK